MPNRVPIESLIFTNDTTLRTDYQITPLMPPMKTVYKAKPTCYRIRPAPLKNLHCMKDWKGPRVPFNLYWKNKDIVRVNPREPQIAYAKPIDHDRERVQKTRPNFVMTPACKLDTVEEPDRTNLIRSIYTTSTVDLMKEPIEVASKNLVVRAPLPLWPAPANPIYLPRFRPPVVSAEWRMDSAAWDGRCKRNYVHGTKEFWLRRDPPKCSACDLSATLEAQKKMKTNV